MQNQLTDKNLKWCKYMMAYHVININDKEEKSLITVDDQRIYFEDGKVSDLFESNDAAIEEATKIINSKSN